MTLPMFMAYCRPLGKDTPITTFDAVCRLLRRFTANSLLLGFNERAWRAYTSDLLSDADSAALALCPQLAIVSVAVADGAAQATVVDIEELLLQWIAIKGVVPELMQTQAMELARIVSAHNLASAVPDLKKSYQVMKSALLGRFYRNQLLTRQNELEDLTRLVWLATEMHKDNDLESKVVKVLGMSLRVFVRSAIVLSSIIFVNCGFVDFGTDVDEEIRIKYEVDVETLKLVAYKLSTTRSDAQMWLAETQRRYPEGLRQFAPSLLIKTPLQECAGSGMPKYICPSLDLFYAALRNWVFDSLGEDMRDQPDAKGLYGEVLEGYVATAAKAAGQLVRKATKNLKHADFVMESPSGCSKLIVEVKRSVATGAASKWMLTPSDVAQTLQHLFRAYEQCWSTFQYEKSITPAAMFAAIIVVDDTIGAEGPLIAELIATRSAFWVPFEVMGVTEFENAIVICGANGLVEWIRKKWLLNQIGVPLARFALDCYLPARLKKEGRLHLRELDNELFGDMTGNRRLEAEWPSM